MAVPPRSRAQRAQAEPEASSRANPGARAATGSAPAYLQSQLANYQTALAWMNTLNGG